MLPIWIAALLSAIRNQLRAVTIWAACEREQTLGRSSVRLLTLEGTASTTTAKRKRMQPISGRDGAEEVAAGNP